MRASTLLAAALLAGCGGDDADSGPGAVSANEARALDEAAEMLDEQRLPATPSPTASPEAGEDEPDEPAA